MHDRITDRCVDQSITSADPLGQSQINVHLFLLVLVLSLLFCLEGGVGDDYLGCRFLLLWLFGLLLQDLLQFLS